MSSNHNLNVVLGAAPGRRSITQATAAVGAKLVFADNCGVYYACRLAQIGV